jgi:hypothetical protein
MRSMNDMSVISDIRYLSKHVGDSELIRVSAR